MQIIILFLAVAIFIAGVMLTLFQTSDKKAKSSQTKIRDAKDKVTEAKQELDHVLKESIQ
jgi:uncharacterized membrane-anchored protein YhcB (DUF1043 family)